MIAAVFDTNVLASGAIAVGGSIATLTDAWRRGTVRVVVSNHILAELERTLHNAYFLSRLETPNREAFLDLARTSTTITGITAAIPLVASTLDDNLVLATAVSAGVPYLVTGDRELLRLGQFESISILSPRQFADLLRAETH